MLFKVIGIEPELFSGELMAYLLLKRTEKGDGRFVAQYPKAWLRQLHEKFGALSGNARKAAEAIIVAGTYQACRTGFPFDSQKSWLENAFDCAGQDLIDCVVTVDGQPEPGDIHVGIHFVDDYGSPFRVEPSKIMQADAHQMVSSIRRLLCYSAVVKVIDPYLKTTARAYLISIQAILGACGPRCERIEFHVPEDDEPLDPAIIRQHLRGILPLDSDAEVLFVRWNIEDMHDRYLITELGGISSGYGFRHNPEKETTLSRISRQDRRILWEKFDSEQGDQEALIDVVSI